MLHYLVVIDTQNLKQDAKTWAGINIKQNCTLTILKSKICTTASRKGPSIDATKRRIACNRIPIKNRNPKLKLVDQQEISCEP